MIDQELQLFRELTETDGVSGFESEIREVLRKYFLPLAELSSDRLGSLIARKKGRYATPRIMVAAHMDEIGFMVTQITEEGFLRFQTIGGWWEQVMLAQPVRVKTRQGDLPGVVGSKPPHILSPEERKKMVEKKEMYIDIGAESGDHARQMGVRPGDVAVPLTPARPMANPDLVMAKAWDDRAGCAVLIRLLQELQQVDHPNTLYAVATVQEEVGLRGAQTSTPAVKPHLAIAVDVGIPGDTPGIRKEDAQTKLGQGPTILLYDASLIPHRGWRDFIMDTADDLGIPYQLDVMAGGGTDAGRMHLWEEGVPSVSIGIPARYIHSSTGVINRQDIQQTVHLLRALIERLDERQVQEIMTRA